MKKSLVLFLMMLFLPTHATLLSDRSIPSLRESAVYLVHNNLSGAQSSLIHSRNGKTISVLVKGKVATTITESVDGRETVADIFQSKFLVTTIFNRPVFTLRDGEEIVGTVQLKERRTGTVIKSIPIDLKVLKELSGTTIHTYKTDDGIVSEITIMYFRNGRKLPYEIGIQKKRVTDKEILSEIFFVRTNH